MTVNSYCEEKKRKKRGKQAEKNGVGESVSTLQILMSISMVSQVAVLNGSAEEQLAILQNAEVHGKFRFL